MITKKDEREIESERKNKKKEKRSRERTKERERTVSKNGDEIRRETEVGSKRKQLPLMRQTLSTAEQPACRR